MATFLLLAGVMILMPMLNIVIGYGFKDDKSPKKHDELISYESVGVFIFLCVIFAGFYWPLPIKARESIGIVAFITPLYYLHLTGRLILLKVPPWVVVVSIGGLVSNLIFAVLPTISW